MFVTADLSQYESEHGMPVGKPIKPALKEKARRLRLEERLTLASIAERLGVSIAVVSRAIGPAPRLRKEKIGALSGE